MSSLRSGDPATAGCRCEVDSRSRILDGSAFAGTMTKSVGSRSRDVISPEVSKFVAPLLKRGRRGCRVRAAPAVSCAKNCAFGAHEHTGSAETLRHPPRNGFTAYFVLSPVERACCHRHLRKRPAKLNASIAAPGPHDFAVRSRTFAFETLRPSHTAPTCRDDGDTPLWWARDGTVYNSDFPKCEAEYF